MPSGRPDDPVFMRPAIFISASALVGLLFAFQEWMSVRHMGAVGFPVSRLGNSLPASISSLMRRDVEAADNKLEQLSCLLRIFLECSES